MKNKTEIKLSEIIKNFTKGLQNCAKHNYEEGDPCANCIFQDRGISELNNELCDTCVIITDLRDYNIIDDTQETNPKQLQLKIPKLTDEQQIEDFIKELKENPYQGIVKTVPNMAITEVEPLKTIKIKYLDPQMPKLEFINGVSDWIDLRIAEDIEMKAFDFKIISLGIAMELPDGHEAHIVPRSSTFKKFSVIQANSKGIIDESYCGDNDIWGFPAIALTDTKIEKYTRICQFRIVKKMDNIDLKEVEQLGNQDRNGFGSTGTK